MNTLVNMRTVLWCCGLIGCAYNPLGGPSPQPVTLSWAAVTASDTGKSVSGRIAYNVYAVPGAGPIPTAPSRSCGARMVAKGSPLNSEPIGGTSYSTNVAPGPWTFAVEAVSSDGCRSGLSPPVTVTVSIQGNSPTNVTVGP